MRYDAEHKEKTRARVLVAAARAIREAGPDRVAVAEVMAAAGLTHGGFYAHFRSKHELVAAAIEEMFADSGRRFQLGSADASPQAGLGRFIDVYLSPAHRDRRSTGCPLPALAADLPRLDPASKESFGRGVAAFTARLAQRLEAAGVEAAAAIAPSVLAELVGALSLSRAVMDERQSDEILAASRESLKGRLGLLAEEPQRR